MGGSTFPDHDMQDIHEICRRSVALTLIAARDRCCAMVEGPEGAVPVHARTHGRAGNPLAMEMIARE